MEDRYRKSDVSGDAPGGPVFVVAIGVKDDSVALREQVRAR